jgi:hypothetical protein
MGNFRTVEEARKFLKEKGYYTDNLWCVDDVKTKFECDDDDAQEILDSTFNDESIMAEIWETIISHGIEEGLTRKD